jgi:hypothetical protein
VGVLKKIKQKRAERKAEREAIERSRQEQLRAGGESRSGGEPFDEYDLSALKP